MNSKKEPCVLCGKEFSEPGNNAEPLAKGVCCDKCNNQVIMARIRGLRGKY